MINGNSFVEIREKLVIFLKYFIESEEKVGIFSNELCITFIIDYQSKNSDSIKLSFVIINENFSKTYVLGLFINDTDGNNILKDYLSKQIHSNRELTLKEIDIKFNFCISGNLILIEKLFNSKKCLVCQKINNEIIFDDPYIILNFDILFSGIFDSLYCQIIKRIIFLDFSKNQNNLNKFICFLEEKCGINFNPSKKSLINYIMKRSYKYNQKKSIVTKIKDF